MKLSKPFKQSCKEDLNIKLVFTSFKIEDYFPYKDSVPKNFKSFLVYKFTCASCSSSYLEKRIVILKPELKNISSKNDKKIQILKHLHGNRSSVLQRFGTTP